MLLSLFLALAGAAQGAGPAARIDGIVSTEIGTPLAGAAITIRDARGQVIGRAISGEAGRFAIAGLPNGIYRVSVSLSNFVTANLNVAVVDQRSTDLAVRLQPATDALVTVASTEVLTTGSTLASDDSMASRELDQFVPGTGFQSAVRMFASVMATQSGVNIKGGRPNQVGVQLEAGSLVDPASAIARVPLPDDAIRSVTVLPNPYEVEYGRFSSGLVSIQTTRGGDRWQFQVNRLAPIIRNNRGKLFSFRIDEFRPRYAVGGPIVPGRLYLEQTGQVRFSSTDVPSRPEDERRVSKSLSSFTRLDANVSSGHSLIATVGLFPNATSALNLGTFTPPDATVDLEAFAKQAAVIARDRLQDGVLNEATAHVLQSRTDVSPLGSAVMALRPETTAGNFFNRQHRSSTSFQFVDTVTVHTFKFGIDALVATFDGTSDSRPVRIERTDGTLARRLDYRGATRQAVTSTDVGAFVQDRLELHRRWTVELGGRLDRDGIVSRVNFAPRIGTVVELTDSRRTVLRAGFGLFHGRTPSAVGAFSAFPGYVDTRFRTDGVTPVAAPIGVTLVAAPDLDTSYSRTWNVGVDHQFNPEWSVHANVLDRDGRKEFIVTPSGGELRLSGDGRSTYRDLELGVHFMRGSRIDVEAQYDWSAARGDLNELSGFFDTVVAPVIGANAYAPLGADVPQRLFVRGRMLASPRLLLLGVFDWATGMPYSTVNETLDFVGLRNDRRFPTYRRLELGLEYRLKVMKWRPWVGVRASNVFAAFLPGDVQANISSPLFGQFYNSEDRHIRVQLRFGT